ncbi:MAG: hypothetical protein V4533_01150 [Pseudomonadota bacterium]|jgi:hypothetical protein
MIVVRRPLIIAISDPGLRSVLAALLTMAGETPISTVDHLDPALGAELREIAILVIDEPLISAAPPEWTETLRNQCWTGSLVIVADRLLRPSEPEDGIMLVQRSQAAYAIPPIISRWQGQAL